MTIEYLEYIVSKTWLLNSLSTLCLYRVNASKRWREGEDSPMGIIWESLVTLISLAPPVTRLVIDYYVHKSAGVLNLGSCKSAPVMNNLCQRSQEGELVESRSYNKNQESTIQMWRGKGEQKYLSFFRRNYIGPYPKNGRRRRRSRKRLQKRRRARACRQTAGGRRAT